MADEPELQPSTAEGETTNDRGQRLVAVPPEKRRGRPRGSKNKPHTEEFRSIDDVVARHVPPEEPPVHTADDEVPPDEPDPAKRTRPTFGPIALTPDAYDPEAPLPPAIRAAAPPAEPAYEPPDHSDGQLRTLEDLNARFDFDGTGQFYIMVTRQKPMAQNGILTSGRMRDIKTSLTHEEFCEFYGGGQYQLIVYGPPARGRLIDPVTNLPKPKALSKPITVVVPYQGEGGRDPNPLAALEYSDPDLDGMRGGNRGDVQTKLLERRTNGLADAKIFEAATQKELTMDQRQREDRREELRERREQEASAVGVVKESAEQMVRILERQVNDLKAELKAKENGKSNGGAEVAGAVAQIVTAMGPRQPGADELQRMKDGYEERIDNLVTTHAAQKADTDARHKRDLEDRERVLTREKEDAIRRAEESARFANQQLEQRSIQLTADRDREREDARKERERQHLDHQREIELLKKDHERDMARQKEHFENLLSVERNTNQRDREMIRESLGTKAELLKSTVESELRAANNEVTRLRADNDRMKAELEEKSNLPKQIEKFSKAAEGLGFTRDEGGGRDEVETDWKTTLLRAGATVAEKLPEIIENAGKVVAMTRGAQAQPHARPGPGMPGMAPPRALPPPQQGPRQYPVTHVPPVWATEDSAPPGGPLPEQFQQAVLPPPPQVHPQPPPQAMPMQQHPMPQAMPTAAPPTVNQAPPPPSRPPAQPSVPPPGATAPPPPVQVSDEDILRFAPTLEEWFGDDKTPPEAYAAQVLALDPNIRLVAPGLTPEAVAAALQRGGRARSPLVRRDGQRFLKRFREAILGAPA